MDSLYSTLLHAQSGSQLISAIISGSDFIFSISIFVSLSAEINHFCSSQSTNIDMFCVSSMFVSSFVSLQLSLSTAQAENNSVDNNINKMEYMLFIFK